MFGGATLQYLLARKRSKLIIMFGTLQEDVKRFSALRLSAMRLLARKISAMRRSIWRIAFSEFQ